MSDSPRPSATRAEISSKPGMPMGSSCRTIGRSQGSVSQLIRRTGRVRPVSSVDWSPARLSLDRMPIYLDLFNRMLLLILLEGAHMVIAAIQTIFAQPDADAVAEQFARIVGTLTVRSSSALMWSASSRTTLRSLGSSPPVIVKTHDEWQVADVVADLRDGHLGPFSGRRRRSLLHHLAGRHQLAARGNSQLPVNLAQVIVDSAGADEHLCRNLRIRPSS